jgi:hypothetical protein
MQTLIIFQKSDGLILSSAVGPEDCIGEQVLPDSAGYMLGVSGNPGQYYNAETGTVQDTAPDSTVTPVTQTSPGEPS